MKLVVPSEISSPSFLRTRESSFQEKLPVLLDERKGQDLKPPPANRYLQMISSTVSRGLRLGNTTTARAHGRQNTDKCSGMGMPRPICATEPPLLRETQPMPARCCCDAAAATAAPHLLLLSRTCCHCRDTLIVVMYSYHSYTTDGPCPAPHAQPTRARLPGAPPPPPRR